MAYSIRQLSVKIIALTLIPILAAIILTIDTSSVMANNISNQHPKKSGWRNNEFSQINSPIRSDQQNPSREINLTPEEAKIFKLISQERAKAGLPQLEIDPILTKLARDKSLDMVCNNYFGHYSERIGTIHDQLKGNSVSYGNAAENLAGGADILKTHRRVLASPAHRSNILNPIFKKIGIGIAKGSAYGKMMTQIFID